MAALNHTISPQDRLLTDYRTKLKEASPEEAATHTTTAVLTEILRQGLEDVAAFAIFDPEAVQQAIAAGIGAEVTLSIGGKIRMPAIPAESPLETAEANLTSVIVLSASG